jgi:hypothetical protein
MLRHVAAVAVALCLSSAPVYAQTTVLTVNAASAGIYKSPSTGSPAIGNAPIGAVLQVTRELGSWVKVSWPDAQDGAGYVHVTVGSIAHGVDSDANRAAASPRSATEPAAPAPTSVQAEVDRIAARLQQPASRRPAYITPASHVVGLGAMVGRMGGSTFGFGVTARAWHHNRLGIQLEVSRYGLTGNAVPGRVTSFEFEPSVLYSVPDRVGDYLWLRPYVGSGATLHRQTLSSVTPGVGDSVSDSGLGIKAFGGGELTFASAPQLALSVDAGYRWSRATQFAGFKVDGLGVSVSGHWYVK